MLYTKMTVQGVYSFKHAENKSVNIFKSKQGGSKVTNLGAQPNNNNFVSKL